MISIVVPIYNAEKYLADCLDSLVAQSDHDIEILCVDDGSTDQTIDILNSYSERYPFFSVVNQHNQGPSAARNRGIDEAKGEWIMFVDSDDWIDRDAFSRLQPYFNSTYQLIAFSYIREFRSQSLAKQVLGEETETFDDKDEVYSLFVRLLAPIENGKIHPDKLDSLSTVWGKLYRTDLIKSNHIRFVPTQVTGTAEDLLFNVDYFMLMQSAIYLPLTIYHYRKNSVESFTSLYKPDLFEKMQNLFHLIDQRVSLMKNQELTVALSYRKSLSLIGQGLNITFSGESWCRKHSQVSRILHSPLYAEPLNTLPLSVLPMHWRVFFWLAKCKCSGLVLLLLQIINKIIDR